jgi:hypothetical protein
MLRRMFVFLRRGTNSNFGMLVTLLLVGCFDVRLIETHFGQVLCKENRLGVLTMFPYNLCTYL